VAPTSQSRARGSLFELEAQVIAAHRLGFIDDAMRAVVRENTRRTAKPLAGLIAYVKRRESRQRATGHRKPAT
jgi:hypothetical protein